VDTNVWLERLLDQEKSEEVGRFLAQIPSNLLFVTDFTFRSIGIILSRLKRTDVLLQFVRDAFIEGNVLIVHFGPEEIAAVVETMRKFGLDFDDAYQYVAAERHDLLIVSFDRDFDRTERRRKTPADLIWVLFN